MTEQAEKVSRKEQVFDTLRREILAARLKVTLDTKRGFAVSPKVKALAEIELPPTFRSRNRVSPPLARPIDRFLDPAHDESLRR